jgi:hypothetical protein
MVKEKLFLEMKIISSEKTVSIKFQFSTTGEFEDLMKLLTKSGKKSLKEKFGFKETTYGALLEEGSCSKGGVNSPPTIPRPFDPPKGQGRK